MQSNSKKNFKFFAAALVLGLSAPAMAQEIDIGDFGGVDVDTEFDGALDGVEGIKVTSGAKGARNEVVLDASGDRPKVEGKVGYTATKKPLKETSKSFTCTSSKGFTISRLHVRGEHNAKMQGSCKITIKNAVLEASSSNLLIQGSGTVKIKNTTLRSDDVGIAIQGSGDVYLKDVDLEADVAIHIQGSGNVIVSNSRVKGRIVREGEGKVIFEDMPAKAKSTDDAKP